MTKLLASCVLVLLAAASGQVPANSFTGKWTYDEATGVKLWGKTDPHAPIATVTLELRAAGNTLTGVIHSHTTATDPNTGRKIVSAETRPAKISSGTIDGNNLSFDLESVIPTLGIKQTTHYTGTLDNDTIHLTGSRYEGDFTYLDTGKKPPSSRKGALLKTTMEVHRMREGAISAMETKQSGESETLESQAKGTPGAWQVDNVTDPMTGKRSLEGFRRYRTNDSQQPGVLEVTATCNTEALNFQIVFLSDSKPLIGLKQSTTEGFGHVNPWVEMRVRIDNDPPRVVTSENDYRNYATIVFSKWAGQGREDGAASIARYALAAKSAGALDKAIQAHSILVELITENNAKELLEINPQDPSFEVFSSACDRSFWGGVKQVLNPDGSIKFTQIPHGPAADGFKFLYTLPLQQRQYRGTVEGFVREFPGFMQQAATVAGFADRDYSKEIAFIIDAVKTCGQITPQMAASVFEPNGRKIWNKPDGAEHLEKLGSQYQVCGKGNGVPVPPEVDGVRGLGLRIEPWGTSRLGNGDADWLNGKGFIAQVLFGQMKGDDRDMRGQRLQPTLTIPSSMRLLTDPPKPLELLAEIGGAVLNVYGDLLASEYLSGCTTGYQEITTPEFSLMASPRPIF
jgi:hypothetical protein